VPTQVERKESNLLAKIAPFVAAFGSRPGRISEFFVDAIQNWNVEFWGFRRSNIPARIGQVTLNVLLSFAQFEREVTGERICAEACRFVTSRGGVYS
jgi:hypothetical protein